MIRSATVIFAIVCARLAESTQSLGHHAVKAAAHRQRRPHLLKDVWQAIFQPINFSHEVNLLSSWLHAGNDGTGVDRKWDQSQNITEWGEFLRRMRRSPVKPQETVEMGQVELDPPICMGEKAVPQLYLLGAQKAGTTTMAADLIAAGIKSATGDIKELHTFDDICGFHRDHYRNESEWNGEVSAGVCPRETRARREWLQTFHRSCAETVAALIDMTPLNLRLPHLPATLRTWYGEDKARLGFIIALREPLKRLHSGFYHARTYGMRHYANFSDYVSMVLKRAPVILAANGTMFGTDYPLDEFYRSMYYHNINPWLRNFEPKQFVIVPMKNYFATIDNRRSVVSTIKNQFGIAAFEEQILVTTQMNRRVHNTLIDDLSEEMASQLHSMFFREDTHRLASALASGIPDGLTLAGYTGTADASNVKEHLENSW